MKTKIVPTDDFKILLYTPSVKTGRNTMVTYRGQFCNGTSRVFVILS